MKAEEDEGELPDSPYYNKTLAQMRALKKTKNWEWAKVKKAFLGFCLEEVEQHDGLKVMYVMKGSFADSIGLIEGDII